MINMVKSLFIWSYALQRYGYEQWRVKTVFLTACDKDGKK